MNLYENEEYLKGINQGKELETIQLSSVLIPTQAVKDIYFRSPVEDLLRGTHKKTGQPDQKMATLKANILNDGWNTAMNSLSDNISLEWEEGRYKVCNGQHRLILINVLGIPHFKADLSINYDIDDQYEALAAHNLIEQIEQYEPVEFDNTFTEKDLEKTEELYAEYTKNKPKKKWYMAFI